MNDLFLGVIAVATLTIAIAQIVVMVVAGRLARRVEQLTERLEREATPLLGHLNAIGRDAAHAASLAAAQVDRADKALADLAARVDQTLNSLQSTLAVPAREGRALFSALRAVLDALRERRRAGRTDDEDALFI